MKENEGGLDVWNHVKFLQKRGIELLSYEIPALIPAFQTLQRKSFLFEQYSSTFPMIFPCSKWAKG
jgi:hypothetical protein